MINDTIIPGSVPDVKIVSKFMLDSDEAVIVDKVKVFTTNATSWHSINYQKGMNYAR